METLGRWDFHGLREGKVLCPVPVAQRAIDRNFDSGKSRTPSLVDPIGEADSISSRQRWAASRSREDNARANSGFASSVRKV